LTPEEIARELVQISCHPYVASDAASRTTELSDEKDDFGKILSIVRVQTGADFFGYKRPTIERRVRRRMVLERISKLSDYLKFLQDNPTRVKTLYEDLLINVTEFFRDPKMFEVLKSEIFPEMLK